MEFVSIRFFDYICTVKIIYMDNKDFVIEDNILVKYCGNASHVVIPDGVTSIRDWVFSGCTVLTSIEIPNSVTSIGNNAFRNCVNLKSIKIPSSVTEIGFCAFNDIHNIKPQYNSNGSLRAFKAFNKDWACMYDFKYEVGKSYHQDGEIICCWNGFHACTNPLDVFNYYNGHLDELRFAEVELSGEIHKIWDKVAASDIKVIRELTLTELAEIYNSMEKL